MSRVEAEIGKGVAKGLHDAGVELVVMGTNEVFWLRQKKLAPQEQRHME